MSDATLPAADAQETARRIDDAVAALPGVLRLYPVDPAVVRSARQLTAGDRGLPLSTVDGEGAAVNVAVDAEAAAPDVTAAVVAAVRSVLGPAARVRVRISRVR